MVVHYGGPPDERPDAGSREIEQRVDVIVIQAVRDTPQQQMPAQLEADPLALSLLVNRQIQRLELAT